jgi:hypothetical protein
VRKKRRRMTRRRKRDCSKEKTHSTNLGRQIIDFES